MEDNRSRRERRALAPRAIEPVQLGLAGAAQIGCLHRQRGQQAQAEVEYLVTSRGASQMGAEAFLNLDRNYWGVERGLHQRLDCSGLEDRLRVRHKGAVPLLGLWSRVGVALFVRWASQPRRVRDRPFPHWQAWHAGHRWQIIRAVIEAPRQPPAPAAGRVAPCRADGLLAREFLCPEKVAGQTRPEEGGDFFHVRPVPMNFLSRNRPA